MVTEKYTLINNFEMSGYWWLPDKPDNKVPGTVNFICNDKIVLEIHGTLYNNGLQNINIKSSPPVIFGFTDDGKSCTLFDNTEIYKKINLPGYPILKYYSKCLFIGGNFGKVEDICFDFLSVKFTYLEEWMSQRPFDKKSTKESDTSLEYILSYKGPSISKFKIPTINSEIQFESLLNIKEGFFYRQMSHSNSVIFEPQEKKSYKWFSQIIDNFKCLLTLFILKPIFFTQVLGIVEKQNREAIYIFFSQIFLKEKKSLLPTEILLTYPEIKTEIETIFDKWYSNFEKFKSTYDLFFINFYNPYTFSRFSFINFMQAIESYHRAKYEGKYLSDDDDYEPIKNELINAIPRVVSNDHREALKNRIKYGNQYSLRKRLYQLFESIDKDIYSLIIDDYKYFCDKITETRHYFTHLDESLKEEALKNDELYFANKKLKQLILILLLLELGISKEKIIKSIKTSNTVL